MPSGDIGWVRGWECLARHQKSRGTRLAHGSWFASGGSTASGYLEMGTALPPMTAPSGAVEWRNRRDVMQFIRRASLAAQVE